MFSRPYGHFVRILVDMDLSATLQYDILAEIQGYAFFVDIEYETYHNIAHDGR